MKVFKKICLVILTLGYVIGFISITQLVIAKYLYLMPPHPPVATTLAERVILWLAPLTGGDIRGAIYILMVLISSFILFSVGMMIDIAPAIRRDIKKIRAELKHSN